MQPRRDVAAILQERARALARPEAVETQATEALLTLSSAGHAVGVPLGRVARAAALRHLTELPGAPSYLLGLTAVDGHLVSVLDLAAFVGLPRSGVADVRGLVVVSGANREIALTADVLLGIVDAPESAIVAVPGGSGPLARVARDLGPQGGDLLVLDVDALFDDPRLARDRG